MYQNNPVTPQTAEVGIAVAQAILAVMSDPLAAKEAIKQAEMARAEAGKLNEREIEEASAGRALIEQSEILRRQFGDWETALREREAVLENTALEWQQKNYKLNADYNAHAVNVRALVESEEEFFEKQKKHNEAVAQLSAQKDTLAKEWKELVDTQEDNKKWENDLCRREQALLGAAENIKKAG